MSKHSRSLARGVAILVTMLLGFGRLCLAGEDGVLLQLTDVQRQALGEVQTWKFTVTEDYGSATDYRKLAIAEDCARPL